MDDLLTIGIATYNSAEVIESCLSSIKENYGEKYRIVVIDNDSKDSTHEIITQRYPNVEVFNTGANFGFAYSVNEIFKHAKSKYVLVVNADIEINQDTIGPLIKVMDEDSAVFVSAPITFDPDGNIEGNIRRFPSLVRQASESLLGGTISQKLGLSETVNGVSEYNKTRYVDWLKGAIWCVRRQDFLDLHGMRNDFFLYSEETEIAHRAFQQNKHCMIVKEATATHLGGESDTHPLLYTLLTLNKLKYNRLNSGLFPFVVMRKILLLAMLIRINKKQSRFALISLLRSTFGFEKERYRIIKKLDGTLAPTFSF